jgi:hypothetical protein
MTGKRSRSNLGGGKRAGKKGSPPKTTSGSQQGRQSVPVHYVNFSDDKYDKMEVGPCDWWCLDVEFDTKSEPVMTLFWKHKDSRYSATFDKVSHVHITIFRGRYSFLKRIFSLTC